MNTEYRVSHLTGNINEVYHGTCGWTFTCPEGGTMIFYRWGNYSLTPPISPDNNSIFNLFACTCGKHLTIDSNIDYSTTGLYWLQCHGVMKNRWDTACPNCGEDGVFTSGFGMSITGTTTFTTYLRDNKYFGFITVP